MTIVMDGPDTAIEQLSSEETRAGTISSSLPDEETLSFSDFFKATSARKPRQQIRLYVHDRGRRSAWLPKVAAQTQALLNLPANWNSYGAKPVDVARSVQAIEVLLMIMRDETPLPTIVPTSVGSIQLEWHMRRVDLEVLILGNGRYDVAFEDLEQGTQWDRVLSSDLKPLVDAIDLLSSRT